MKEQQVVQLLRHEPGHVSHLYEDEKGLPCVQRVDVVLAFAGAVDGGLQGKDEFWLLQPNIPLRNVHSFQNATDGQTYSQNYTVQQMQPLQTFLFHFFNSVKTKWLCFTSHQSVETVCVCI